MSRMSNGRPKQMTTPDRWRAVDGEKLASHSCYYYFFKATTVAKT